MDWQGVAIVVAIVVVSIVVGAGLYYVVSSSKVKPTPGLTIYADSACTQTLTTISWGNVRAGTNVQRIIYVKNTGTGTPLTLSMTTIDWSPTGASTYVSITWTADGVRLTPQESSIAFVTLSSNANTPTGLTFTNTIVISGNKK